MWASVLSLRLCGGGERKHNIAITIDLSKHHNVDQMSDYYPFRYMSSYCIALKLTSKYSEIFVLELRERMQTEQRVVSEFLTEWIASWYCFSHYRCLTDLFILRRWHNAHMQDQKYKIATIYTSHSVYACLDMQLHARVSIRKSV